MSLDRTTRYRAPRAENVTIGVALFGTLLPQRTDTLQIRSARLPVVGAGLRFLRPFQPLNPLQISSGEVGDGHGEHDDEVEGGVGYGGATWNRDVREGGEGERARKGRLHLVGGSAPERFARHDQAGRHA